MSKKTMEKRFYSIEEFMQITGISRAMAYNLISNNTITFTRLGRRILIPVSVVDALLAGTEQSKK